MPSTYCTFPRMELTVTYRNGTNETILGLTKRDLAQRRLHCARFDPKNGRLEGVAHRHADFARQVPINDICGGCRQRALHVSSVGDVLSVERVLEAVDVRREGQVGAEQRIRARGHGIGVLPAISGGVVERA